MADITEIVEYYANLLIIQYNRKPKARATVEAIVNEVFASGVLLDIRDGYDLDTAVGVQLDILGKYIGIDRFFLSQDFSDDYFGFADATNVGGVSSNIVGFDDANAPDKSGLFLDAENVIAQEFRLNDDAYRILLKLKIVQNYSNHSVKSITDSLFDFFGDTIILKDNYNMTITYFIGDVSNELVKAALDKDVLPRPMGVGMQVLNGNEFFGFADAEKLDAIPDYIVGFNDATVGLTKSGGFLNANRDIIN